MLHRAYLPGQRLASSRRQITRYALVSMLITFTSISHRVAKKYKTFQTLVEAGLLTEREKAAWSTLIGRGMSRLVSHWSRTSPVMLAPAVFCHKG